MKWGVVGRWLGGAVQDGTQPEGVKVARHYVETVGGNYEVRG